MQNIKAKMNYSKIGVLATAVPEVKPTSFTWFQALPSVIQNNEIFDLQIFWGKS